MSHAGDLSAALEVRGFGVSRGGRPVCRALSFTVGAGERLEITGANGAGKTSLLRALAGLSDSCEGQLLWRGREWPDVRFRYLRELTYIAHRPGLRAELSARENLLFYTRLKCIPASGINSLIDRSLARFKLESSADVPCGALSEGQRRRVALARLPLEQTVLWFLDEPAAALDREGVSIVESLLKAHANRGGIAIIATHQPLGGGVATGQLYLPLETRDV